MRDYLTRDEIESDVDFYINLINEAHADPYRMISRERFIEKAKDVKGRIEACKTDIISYPGPAATTSCRNWRPLCRMNIH